MGWGVDSTVSKCRVRGFWLCRNQETLFFLIGDTFCSFTGAGPDPNTPHHKSPQHFRTGLTLLNLFLYPINLIWRILFKTEL